MTISRRLTAPVLVLSLLAAPMSGTLLAAPASAPLTLNGEPIAVAAPALDVSVAQPVYYPRPPRHRNQGAATAIWLGAVGAIAGTATLIYANRPECGVNPNAGGCGYGTKVIGGSVLASGAVGLIVGAALWR